MSGGRRKGLLRSVALIFRPLEEKKRSLERKKAPEAKESAPRHTQHFNPAARVGHVLVSCGCICTYDVRWWFMRCGVVM